MMGGLVLGAGESRRLGRPKQTLPLADTLLVGWVVSDVVASSLDRVVVLVDAATGAALPELDRIEHTAAGRPRPRDVDTWDDYEAVLTTLTAGMREDDAGRRRRRPQRPSTTEEA
jgi:MobA-like NTP transferase domain